MEFAINAIVSDTTVYAVWYILISVTQGPICSHVSDCLPTIWDKCPNNPASNARGSIK